MFCRVLDKPLLLIPPKLCVTFSNLQIIYKKKQQFVCLFSFVKNSIYNVRNIFLPSKSRYFKLSFLATQRFVHPTINVHVTLNMKRMDVSLVLGTLFLKIDNVIEFQIKFLLMTFLFCKSTDFLQKWLKNNGK